MSILNKYKRWKNPLTIIRDKYWDFVLSMDNSDTVNVDGSNTEKCLSAYIDLSDDECYENSCIVSKKNFTWEDAINNGAELKDIGFTGMDNGIIKFDKDTISDFDFYNRLTHSEINVTSGDTRLRMRPVDGNTKAYSYDICQNNGFLSLRGGFYQGFYKLFGFDYQTLPTAINDEMVFEFTLRPVNYATKPNTLNNFYPNNRGIFFYMGTRAENKFAKMYGVDLSNYPDRVMTGQTDCHNYFYDDYFIYDEVCKRSEINAQDLGSYFADDYLDDEWLNNHADLDSGETFDFETEKLYDSEGDEITSDPLEEIETDNKFLFIDRTKDGFTYDTWDDNNKMVLQYSRRKLNANLFLLLNRSKTGLTYEDKEKIMSGEYVYVLSADTIIHVDSGETVSDDYDMLSDIYNNAFALKINDDMSIGYRYLVRDCDSETGYAILEESTFPNMVQEGKWSTVSVKFKVLDGGIDNCGNPIGKRKMKIFIYVDGYLKLVSKELDDFNFHELDDLARRQETVPFNISLGGGTQGLAESIWIKYKEMFPKVLPIEENFAGSFIGDIKTFKIYNCPLQYNEIKNNYLYERENIIL